MKPILLALFAIGGVSISAAAEPKLDIVSRWEYRVLTEEQVIALAKKDLAAGLNKLGDEGWELVSVGTNYIFKRPKGLIQQQTAEIKRRIAQAEADVEAWKERVTWSERMVRKGYMTETQAESERTRLKKAEMVLEEARETLKELPSEPKNEK